jgi:RNA polymerase sigma factor (sigma-70 family)
MPFKKIICLLCISSIYGYNPPKYCHDVAKDNFKLVPYHAKNYIARHKLNSDQCNDLIQEGYIGLMLAARKYDKNNNINAKFTTYSSYWIKSYMSSYIKTMYKQKYNNIDIYDNLCKTYDLPVYTKINMDILNPLEKDIVYRRYIKKPRDISNVIAKDYGMTQNEVVKISLRGIKKLKTEYITQQEML